MTHTPAPVQITVAREAAALLSAAKDALDKYQDFLDAHDLGERIVHRDLGMFIDLPSLMDEDGNPFTNEVDAMAWLIQGHADLSDVDPATNGDNAWDVADAYGIIEDVDSQRRHVHVFVAPVDVNETVALLLRHSNVRDAFVAGVSSVVADVANNADADHLAADIYAEHGHILRAPARGAAIVVTAAADHSEGARSIPAPMVAV